LSSSYRVGGDAGWVIIGSSGDKPWPESVEFMTDKLNGFSNQILPVYSISQKFYKRFTKGIAI
jgi:hypothetical protein